MRRERAIPKPNLAEQLRFLPARPGVYIFRDAKSRPLYVGKAKSLRARVRAYFQRDTGSSPRLRSLIRRIDSLETFLTASETEALLLEWNLIREYRPPFNIQLRDDKSYPYIKVTVREPFPRIFVTRTVEADGSRYFGPFTDVRAMRRALRAVKRMYTVRTCHYRLPTERPERPCLDYHIGRCKAPCVGLQTAEEYGEMISEILQVLAGQTGVVRRAVQRRMREAVDRLDFERAAELKEILRGLRALESRQVAIDLRGEDRDVLGIGRASNPACGVVLRIREGRLVGRRVQWIRAPEGAAPEELVAAFVKSLYLSPTEAPPEVLVPTEFPDRPLVERYVTERAGRTFRIRAPQRGEKRKLVQLAAENAEHVLREGHGMSASGAEDTEQVRGPAPAPEGARRLAAVLGLGEPPRSILCFDVSALSGAECVGSAVWLEEGRPEKEAYRRFRVRGAEPGRPDDYAAMQEIVGRYFNRAVQEGRRLPDLVLVDGGPGQLSAALQGMEGVGVTDLPVIALAKREEVVHQPDGRAPLQLAANDPALRWLQRARDEAHRFALRYHRTLRRRRTLKSQLSDVPGVGPTLERRLLRRFGSLKGVAAASVEALRSVPGIGPATAARIHETLSREPGKQAATAAR